MGGFNGASPLDYHTLHVFGMWLISNPRILTSPAKAYGSIIGYIELF